MLMQDMLGRACWTSIESFVLRIVYLLDWHPAMALDCIIALSYGYGDEHDGQYSCGKTIIWAHSHNKIHVARTRASDGKAHGAGWGVCSMVGSSCHSRLFHFFAFVRAQSNSWYPRLHKSYPWLKTRHSCLVKRCAGDMCSRQLECLQSFPMAMPAPG